MKENKNLITVSLTMSSVPINLYKKFVSDIKKYNDIYWVKLLDIMRKAEAYDYLISGQGFETDLDNIEEEGMKQMEEEIKSEKREEKESVKTFGGEIEV